MASIATRKNGTKIIQFSYPKGQRQTIQLGRLGEEDAMKVKRHIEELVFAKTNGYTADRETRAWLHKLRSQPLYDKLATVDLAEKISPASQQGLAPYLDDYIKRRTDVKPPTRSKYISTRNSLVDFFGVGKRIDEITPGDADEWRLHLLEQEKGSGRPGKPKRATGALKAGESCSENTIRKHASVAKVLFKGAVRKKLIPENPFADLPSHTQANPERMFFVTREHAASIIEACPDAQWRLLFALARYGGMRTPSEPLLLRWSDVNWEQGRMTVTAPKTERFPDGKYRVTPIFPELRPFMDEMWELAGPGADRVITICDGKSESYLRTMFKKILKRAGLSPWPKLWQNLRSSRQTELEDQFPTHVVCKWLGNTPKIAHKHYHQMTEAHFARALTPDGSALQKAQHFSVATAPNGSSGEEDNRKNQLENECLPLTGINNLAEAGIEPARGLPPTGF